MNHQITCFFLCNQSLDKNVLFRLPFKNIGPKLMLILGLGLQFEFSNTVSRLFLNLEVHALCGGLHVFLHIH